MRIVHIITRLIVGGAQENTLLSCEGQHDLGHDVTLLTGPAQGPEGSLMERAASYGYRVEAIESMRRAVNPLWDYRASRELGRRLRAISPDIVHTHSSKAGILGRWAAHRAGVKAIVHTIHGLAFTASTSSLINDAYRRLERITAPVTSKIVCVADAMRDQSLAAGIGAREQYITIYSGMGTAAFLKPAVDRQAVRKSLGIEPEHIAVGTIARLFDLKGHDDLLDLAPDLCASHPLIRFLWIGDGSLRGRLEARMHAMGLQSRFILTGLVPPARIPELAGAMDILVHPSRREGLARALPQGALAGSPVVTYDIDGNREGLVEGVTGYAVRPFDKLRLGRCVAELACDATRRRSMGSAGRDFALARFDTDVMVKALDRLYQELLAG